MMIIDEGLCTRCGACYAICPHDAITMQMALKGTYRPRIDNKKCVFCGLCKKACPSFRINPKISTNSIGDFICCYAGCSSDEFVRQNSSSGGLVPTILSTLMDKGLISGAVILRENFDNPLKPLMTFVDDKEKIKSTVGSKYCPVRPMFKVKDLINTKGKVVVVGLPCHIWAFRRLEEMNSILKAKIFLYAGLLCGKCPNFYATAYFVKQRAGVVEKNVEKIVYRGRGQSVQGLIKTKRGDCQVFEYGDWISFSYFPQFIPVHCVLCYDITNQQADLSLGDAWGISRDKTGVSIAITRTARGEQLIQNLIAEKILVLREVSENEVFKGQGVKGKVRNSLIRTSMWQRFFKKSIPLNEFDYSNLSVSIKEWVFNFGYCTLLYMTQNYFIRLILCNLTPYMTFLKQGIGWLRLCVHK